MKRVHLALVAVLALIAGLIATVPAQAKDVTFVEGIVNGKFGQYQAFDVSRVPSDPTCTNGAPDILKITVKDSPAPSSGASGSSVELGDGWLQVFESGDANYPWGLDFYNADGKQLRYDSVSRAWITEPAGGWGSEKRFSAAGNLVAANQNGILHLSKETGANWGGGYGTFISITTPYLPKDVINYTPASDLNNCTTYFTPTAGGAGNNTLTGPVLNPLSAKTMLFPDAPLGMPTNDATVRKFIPSVGEIEGKVSSDVVNYNWGISFDYSNFTNNTVKIYPTNAASPIKVADKIYRSGQPIAIPPVAVGTPFDLKFTVYSVDGSVSKDYTVVVRAWPGRLPQVTKLSTRYAQNTGGQKIDISGKYLNFTKGAYFTPLEDPDIYGSRAVVATREDKKYKWVTDRTSWTYAPAVPKPGGGNYTGTYNVILDTPYGNTEVDPNIASITYQNPQKPLTALQFAKKITQGVTKLLGLPIKMNSGSIPKIKFSVRFGKRAKPTGDFALYEITKRSDGYYINWKTAQRGTVTAVVTAKRTQKYAPYYKEKVWKTK